MKICQGREPHPLGGITQALESKIYICVLASSLRVVIANIFFKQANPLSLKYLPGLFA
jgi:hypothetical protein